MRLRALLLTTLPLLLLLVACGDDDTPDDAPDDNEPVTSATPYVVMPTAVIVQGSPTSTSNGSNPGGSGGGNETSYTVESGDTLGAIAARYGTTVEAIMTRNNIDDPTDLQVGQQLAIPGGTAPAPTPPATQPTATTQPSAATPAATETPDEEEAPDDEATAEPDGNTYVVEDGDLAGSIADQFGITLEELADANNRTVDSLDALTVGEELIIPSS